MIREKSILMSVLIALSALVTSDLHAEEKAKEGQTADAPSEQKIADSLKKLVFVPHDAGAPEVTDAGGVRSITTMPKVELLAPERMARTLSPTPTLYWHMSAAATGPIRFTLLAEDPTVFDPLLEFEIDGIDRKGIFGVSLRDHGFALQDGQRYIWSIAVSHEGSSFGSDVVAQTMLEHAAAPGLAQALDGKRPDERAIRLAAEGYWYDAIDTLSVQIGGSSPTPWQSARAELLDQAGLFQAATFDRRDLPD